jgi:hypothetical protein
MPYGIYIDIMINEIGLLQIKSSASLQNINFSQVISKKRINKANKLLGAKVVTAIIAYALFLLGVTRKGVSQLIHTPYETFNSFIKRMGKDGIDAFQDRRLSDDDDTEPMRQQPLIDRPMAEIQGDEVVVHLPYETSRDIDIRIPYANKLMIKAVLLTLMQNQILDSKTVANILGYTQSHTLSLNRKIIAGSTDADVEVLVDHRQGQKQCYVFNPEVKAELIQQCSANAIVGKSTSSQVLAANLKERCDLDLPQRSIRYYVEKLGLKNIAKTLPEIIHQLKKNSVKS